MLTLLELFSAVFLFIWCGNGLSTSDVVETTTFETEVWLKLRDRDFIKNPETKTETLDVKFKTESETSKFMHFAEVFAKKSLSLL